MLTSLNIWSSSTILIYDYLSPFPCFYDSVHTLTQFCVVSGTKSIFIKMKTIANNFLTGLLQEPWHLIRTISHFAPYHTPSCIMTSHPTQHPALHSISAHHSLPFHTITVSLSAPHPTPLPLQPPYSISYAIPYPLPYRSTSQHSLPCTLSYSAPPPNPTPPV